MVIHYRHKSNPDVKKVFNTELAFKNCPAFLRGDRTLLEYTKFQIEHMNEDLLRGHLLYFSYSYPRGGDIVIKNDTGNPDAMVVLKGNGFEDLTSNINCMTHKIFFKENKFYCFIGWNRNDPKFNGSLCIREL